MNIFISWSGHLSREVATELRTWLKSVIQATDPWMSKEDIPTGSLWFGQISSSIKDSEYGILCITRENKNAPWLLWEAGALYRGFEETRRVVPLLIDLKKEDLGPPLSNFQAVEINDQQDVLRMLKGINSDLPNQLPDDILKVQNQLYWDKLQKKISNAIERFPLVTASESTCEYTFGQAAERFLKMPGKRKDSIRRDTFALRIPRAYIDDLPLDKVDNEALRQFKEDRLSGSIPSHLSKKKPRAAKPGTLNKELRTISAVLNRAVDEWHWIPYAPKIKQVPLRGERRPYVLSWDEQQRVLQELPKNARSFALFAVNTGMGRGIIQDLEWSWLKTIPNTKIPMFVVPPGYRDWKHGRTILLNSIAQDVIRSQNRKSGKYVFVGKHGGKFISVSKIWSKAWKKAGLPTGTGYAQGLDNLRRTFEYRLQTARVSQEDREALLWLSSALKKQIHNPPDYLHLLECVEKITKAQDETIVNL